MTQSTLSSPRGALFAILPPALQRSAPPWLRVRVTDLSPRQPLPRTLPGAGEVVHIVLDGWVGSRAVLSHNIKPLCHVSMPGDMVGLSTLWPRAAAGVGGEDDHAARADQEPAEAYALGAVSVASVPVQDLHRIMSETPKWRDFVLSELSRNLHSHHMMHAVCGSMVAPDRLIHLLYALMRRHRAVLGKTVSILPLPLTQGEIGQILGLTNVSVNRAFRTLEGKEMLKLERGCVTLLNEQAWVGSLEYKTEPFGRAGRFDNA